MMSYPPFRVFLMAIEILENWSILMILLLSSENGRRCFYSSAHTEGTFLLFPQSYNFLFGRKKPTGMRQV